MTVLRIRIKVYVAASLVDLISTLVLVYTGRAIEVNPIAAQFAHDAVQLTLFKAILVGLVILVACQLAKYSRRLAENAMLFASVITMLVVSWGLSTVPIAPEG